MGKTDIAKWTLLRSADKELDEIIQRNRRKSQTTNQNLIISKTELNEGKQGLLNKLKLTSSGKKIPSFKERR